MAKRGGKRDGAGRPVGTKNWDTIAIEKAREYYLQQVAERLPPLVRIHLDEALLAKNKDEMQYALNQLVGKPTETIQLHADVALRVDV